MRRLLVAAFLVFAVVGAGGAALWLWPVPAGAGSFPPDGDARRGAYLARVSGCIACHTDVDGGGQPLAGGLALKTRFGTFHSPNLTTDEEHGIGGWSVAEFARAVREGVSPDGEPYYPAFPYPFYAGFSDRDIADLWAAFQTVPPVAAASRPHELGFPYGFRPGLKLWRGLFLAGPSLAPDPARSGQWNRGAYLVRGPAHCGACHTPRNFAGAREAGRFLHGARDLPDGGKSPPITPQALAAGGWTADGLAYALKTGITPEGDTFKGAMGEVVRDSTSFMTDDDLAAIAAYLTDRQEATR